MSTNVESEEWGGRYLGEWKSLLEVMSLEVPVKVSGQLQECRAGGREFQILGDATEKLWAPNDVHATVSRLISEDHTEIVYFCIIAASSAFPVKCAVTFVNSLMQQLKLYSLTSYLVTNIYFMNCIPNVACVQQQTSTTFSDKTILLYCIHDNYYCCLLYTSDAADE